MHHHDITPPWHYHLIDAEPLMLGYLAAQGITVPMPWRSDDLAALVGVSPAEGLRHTALGDARFALDCYDAVMAGVAPLP